jgi:hypothetical protein
MKFRTIFLSSRTQALLSVFLHLNGLLPSSNVKQPSIRGLTLRRGGTYHHGRSTENEEKTQYHHR